MTKSHSPFLPTTEIYHWVWYVVQRPCTERCWNNEWMNIQNSQRTRQSTWTRITEIRPFFKVGKPKTGTGSQQVLHIRQICEQKAIFLKIKRESYKISNRNVQITSEMVTTWRLVQCLPCDTSNRKQCAVKRHPLKIPRFGSLVRSRTFSIILLPCSSVLTLKGTTEWLETKHWEAWAVWLSTVCCKARPKRDVTMWAGYRQRHHEKTCALWVCEK